MKLQETDHNYYCSESNYYVNGSENYGRTEYDTFDDFVEEWGLNNGEFDCDLNLCFRYDILRKMDEDANELDEYVLWLFFILQRKGIYRPVLIRTIEEKDMDKLEKFLKQQWEYMNNQWIELRGEK